MPATRTAEPDGDGPDADAPAKLDTDDTDPNTQADTVDDGDRQARMLGRDAAKEPTIPLVGLQVAYK